ncbi:MAG: tetratricopeptide repeat protein [Humidesulfovibrio sp.]|uniref:tetratricopeptide repeat protein n=1 Tax=Humidesulfovibrio sp. TaxID=2910988 RepID=UPI002734819E|nr:tetratricopeptide repeat protein [Humidesulfovibrio sp.]MDP2847291.1 tetratricopeptide repeat protein [Humidesulfovibrio sp.]
MAQDKKEEIDVSRRRLLFGFLDRARGAESAPMAAASQTAPMLAQANTAYAAADFPAAAGFYKSFLQAESDNAEARQRYGECLYRQGQYIQAKVEFERLLQKDRKNNRAILFLGLVLARLDRVQKAAVVWKLFFDPHSVVLQRELNLQIALVETAAEEQLPAAASVADAVERVLAQPKTA